MTFDEFYEYGKETLNKEKKWSIYASGGVGSVYHKVGSFGYVLENFRETDNGLAFDINKYNFDKFVSSYTTVVKCSCYDYKFEIYREKPLQILMEWTSNIEGVKGGDFIILEEFYDI